MNQTKNLLLGATLVVIAFFCVAASNAIVKLIGPDLPKSQILFTQYFVSLCLIAIPCLRQNTGFKFLKSNCYRLLFIRSLGGLGAFYFVYISIGYISLADATLLLNTGPFFLPFLILLFFKEPVAHKLWWGIIPGFLGVAFILKPESNFANWNAFVPLLSGLSVAVVFISLRELHKRKEPMLRILFYLFFFAACITLPFAASVWRTPTFNEGVLLALACMTSFLSQTLVTVGLKYGSAKALVPLSYSSVVFAIILDWLFWDQVPTWLSFLGILLVMISGVVTLIIENQSVKNKERLSTAELASGEIS